MNDLPRPPATYDDFTKRYPKLLAAWDQVREAEGEGPLDKRTRRLIKLAVAIGVMREGAVHSATRKAIAAGATEEELNQVVALSAASLGFPSTVAVFSWVRDVVDGKKKD